MLKQPFDYTLQRKDSCDSTTSSQESAYLEDNQDGMMLLKINDRKSYPKISIESQMQMRKSVQKINNLRFLGLLKAKDDNNKEAVDDVEVFKKILKVTQKGLQFDQNQYFLQLNSAVMNNRLRRQASPVERLKINLYDDEKPNSTQFLSLPTEQNHQMLQHNHSSNAIIIPSTPQQPSSSLAKTTKKATIRRRSCYCPLTGKQSKKGKRMDFLFPRSLIKNRIFMKMKRKQELKVKALPDKDLIIQNLNKTFDFQEKTAEQKKKSPKINAANGEQIPNIFNFIESTSPQANRTGVAQGKFNAGMNQPSQQLNQGLSQSKSQYYQIPCITPKNNNNTATTPGGLVSLSEQVASIQQNIRKSKIIIDQKLLNNPQLSNKATVDLSEILNLPSPPQSIMTLKNIQSGGSTPQVQKFQKTKALQGNVLSRISLIEGGPATPQNYHSEGFNGRKSQGYTSLNATPSSRNSVNYGANNNININSFSAFKKSSIAEYGKRQSIVFGSIKKKEDQSNNGDTSYQPRNSVETAFPGFFDKRKKLIAKLRVASKLVGIQEKQRKKSLLYQQDYYNALQNMDSNLEVDSDKDKETEEEDGMLTRKKTLVTRKVRTEEENISYNAQVVTQQIIDSHNLRINNTLNSFIDQRAKSHNDLLSNLIILEEPFKPRRSPERNKKYNKLQESHQSSVMLLTAKKHKGNSKDPVLDSPFLVQIASPGSKKIPQLLKSHHKHSRSHQLLSTLDKDGFIEMHPQQSESAVQLTESQQQQQQQPVVVAHYQHRIRSMEKPKKLIKYFNNNSGQVKGNEKSNVLNSYEYNNSLQNSTSKIWNFSNQSSSRSLVLKNSPRFNFLLNKYDKNAIPSARFLTSSINEIQQVKSQKILNSVIPPLNTNKHSSKSYLPLSQHTKFKTENPQQNHDF